MLAVTEQHSAVPEHGCLQLRNCSMLQCLQHAAACNNSNSKSKEKKIRGKDQQKGATEKNKAAHLGKCFKAIGFEPMIFCTQNRHITRLCYTLIIFLLLLLQYRNRDATMQRCNQTHFLKLYVYILKKKRLEESKEKKKASNFKKEVCSKTIVGFEPTSFESWARYSNQLNYTVKKGGVQQCRVFRNAAQQCRVFRNAAQQCRVLFAVPEQCSIQGCCMLHATTTVQQCRAKNKIR